MIIKYHIPKLRNYHKAILRQIQQKINYLRIYLKELEKEQQVKPIKNKHK